MRKVLKSALKSLVNSYIVFAVLLTGTSFLNAAENINSKIAVVDIQKVIQSAPQMAEIRKKLETNFQDRRAKLVSLESSLKANMEKFKKESAVLSEKQKKELEKSIIGMQQTLQRDGEKYQQDVSSLQNELMEDFYNKIRATIKNVAEKNSFELVLQKDAAPYSISQLDITAMVLKELKIK